jgi:glucose-1-phosphate cytidylyltransferase
MDGGMIKGGSWYLNQKSSIISKEIPLCSKRTLETVAGQRELKAYKHEGFWQCMDTQRDKDLLEKLLAEKKAPWVKW